MGLLDALAPFILFKLLFSERDSKKIQDTAYQGSGYGPTGAGYIYPTGPTGPNGDIGMTGSNFINKEKEIDHSEKEALVLIDGKAYTAILKIKEN